MADANAQIKALQDRNKTSGDKAEIKANYTKISRLRDTYATANTAYTALKKAAEDLVTANRMLQADEDKQVEQ